MSAKDQRTEAQSIAYATIDGEVARVLGINATTRLATIYTHAGERVVPLSELCGISSICFFGSGG